MRNKRVYTGTVIRIDRELHHLAKLESVKDGTTIQAWLSKLVIAELQRRGIAIDRRLIK